MENKARYTFRTIVAPDQVRADFTVLRERLETSDKELMQAFWNVAMANIEQIKAEVVAIKEQAMTEREAKRELKIAAKRKEKVEKKPKAKKAPKAEKAPKPEKAKRKTRKKADEVAKVVDFDDDDDFQTVVVDGTV